MKNVIKMPIQELLSHLERNSILYLQTGKESCFEAVEDSKNEIVRRVKFSESLGQV